MNIKVYDNGGETFDRYTVVYLDCPAHYEDGYEAVGMSIDPTHPQGYGQHCTAMLGEHLGEEIEFKALPKKCREVVLADLKEME